MVRPTIKSWRGFSVVRIDTLEMREARAALTVRTAPVLVTAPALFVTTTVYVPASAADTDESVSVEPVAPGIIVPFRRH
jgi:hypothetical protein